MPDQPPFDIAHADNWRGFRPGMTRAQVEEKLRQAGIKETVYTDEDLTAEVQGQHLHFWFESDAPQRLRQIATDGEILWNGRPLMDGQLDDALRALEPLGQTPMWEANDATNEPFPEPEAVPVGPILDEALLAEATVWLPDRGLGLVIWQGGIMDVVWRETRDLPPRFAGPVTEAQRQLSKQPDLEDRLRSQAKATASAAAANAPKDPLSWLNTALILVCLGLLAVIARNGFQEMQRWNAAVTLTGKFVSMEEVPRKKYLDLGPEAVRRHMPDDPTQRRELYHIRYLDPTGRSQTATIEGAEFYVPPREPGEGVEIAYMDGNPPEVKGPSRAQNAAFVKYIPWAMAVGVFYLIAQFIIGFLPRLLRLLAKVVVPKNNHVDLDRPELR